MLNNKPSPGTLSDNELYILCKNWGSQALSARRKFAGLLPEVNKRQLHKKKGFNSIFEFAAKMAGMSEEQVRVVLNLERKFEDKPILHSLLVTGEVSANKLVRVASIATEENDEELGQKAKILSKSAMDTFIRDYKYDNAQINKHADPKNPNQNCLLEPQNNPKSLPVHSKVQDIGQDVKLMQKLSPELKEKLIQLDKKGLDINEILLELLQKRELEIAQEREKLAREEVAKTNTAALIQKNMSQTPNKTIVTISKTAQTYINQSGKTNKLKIPTRYINVKIRKVIKQEYGTKCSIPSCSKKIENIHHEKPFALFKTHDPRFLKPLCKEHHELAHMHDQQYQKFRKTGTAKEGYRVSTFP